MPVVVISLKTLIAMGIIYIVGFLYFTVYLHSEMLDRVPDKIRWIPALLIALIWPVAVICLIIFILFMFIKPERKPKGR